MRIMLSDKRKMQTDKKISRLSSDAAFVVLALALSYLESFLPSFGLPGAKLGLVNIALMLCTYRSSAMDAFSVSLCRIAVSFLLFGNVTSLVFSLFGTALSCSVMAFLKKHPLGLSFIGISVASAFAHNMGQLAAAYITIGSAALSYAPILVFASAVFGTISGIVMTCIPSKIFNGEV